MSTNDGFTQTTLTKSLVELERKEELDLEEAYKSKFTPQVRARMP